MNICIPVTEDKGLSSPVCAHFGSAPFFLIVDSESGQCRAIANRNQHHAHGTCQPLNAIAGEQVDSIVVGGIGMGALSKLMASGMKVFLAEHPTVQQTVDALKAGKLSPVTLDRACSGHGHGPRGTNCLH